MFLLIQWLSRLVLLLLAALSVWSISIMIERRRVLQASKSSDTLDTWKEQIQTGRYTLTQGTQTRASTLRTLLAFQNADIESVDRAIRAHLTEERTRLEKGLTVLATLGSNAPFVGLFGTVLGIIHAFGELSQAQVGTQAVMASISEALIATAVGLLVAIPAVVAYNYFQKEIRHLLTEGEVLRDHFLACRGKQK